MKTMKNIIAFALLLLNIPIYAQIYPGDGLIPVSGCDFDNDCTLVTLDTNLQGNIWRIGEPTKTYFTPAYSVPNAIVTDLHNSYPQGNDSWFDIKINLWDMGLPNPVVTFRHKFDTDSLHDGGFVEISYDKGSTWRNVVFDTSCFFMSYDYGTPNREWFYSSSDTIAGGIPAFSGKSDGWLLSKIQWLWFIPVKETNDTPSDSVFLRFHFMSDSVETGKPGWIIDDIMIYNTLVSDIPEWIENGKNISIFPNPATEAINLDLEDKENLYEVRIYDLAGHCIYNNKYSSEPIPVRAFKSGIYKVTVLKDSMCIYHGIFMKE